MPRSRVLILVVLVAALAASALTYAAVETSHPHLPDGSHPEAVSGAVDQESAGTPDSRRCNYGNNTSVYWVGSWREVLLHNPVRFTRNRWNGMQWIPQEKWVYIVQHRWLNAWPRHDHRVDCPWRDVPRVA